MSQYLSVSDEHLARFSEKVNKAFEDGYQPAGPPVYFFEPEGYLQYFRRAENNEAIPRTPNIQARESAPRGGSRRKFNQ